MEQNNTLNPFGKVTMTIARFCGLIQTDGNVSFFWDNKDSVFHPRIILSHTGKDSEWLTGIQAWLLTSFNITSLISKADDPKATGPQRARNLTIERAQCRDLIDLIDKEEEKNKTPLLFEQKAKDFFLLKKAIEINDIKKNKKTLADKQIEATKLVAIKEELTRTRKDLYTGPNRLSHDELTRRAGCAGIKTEGAADAIILEVNKVVELRGKEVLQKVNSDPANINEALADYIAGVFDGDGSFAVSLQTKEGGKLEIVPQLSVTDAKSESSVNYYFSILCAVFGKTFNSSTQVGELGGGERIYITSKEMLLKYAIPLFEKHPPSLNKNIIRFETFKDVLNKLPQVINSKQDTIDLIKFIYATDLYERSRTEAECLALVEEYFKGD